MLIKFGKNRKKTYAISLIEINLAFMLLFENLKVFAQTIDENPEASINVFSHHNVVTIMNEQRIPVKQVEIMDMYGRLVWAGETPNIKTEIPLTVATGLYHVRILTHNNQQLTTKVIINH